MVRTLVCYTAVFSAVTFPPQECCMTTQKMAV